MAKILISDLASELSERFGYNKQDTTQFLNRFVETIRQGVADDQMVKVKGLGTFKTVDVEARESVNVNTGERVTIDSHTKLSFVADNSIKELVNRPFSQFETVVLNQGVNFDDMPIDELEEPLVDGDLLEEDTAIDAFEEEINQPSAAEPVDEGETLTEESQVAATETEEQLPEEEQSAEENTPAVEENTPAAEENIPAAEENTPAAEDEPVTPVTSTEEKTAEAENNAPDTVEEESTVEPSIADENINNTIDDDDDTDETRPNYWWIWLILALAACVISFAAGYLFGSKTTHYENVVEEVPVTVEPHDTIVPPVPVDTIRKDTLTLEETPSKPEVQKAETPVAAVSTVEEWKKYEEMDVRVRTGAYRIVGTDQVIKARAGDTVSRIARRTLGEGMECYIEVFNGINAKTPLEAGQEVKIPKLQWKKKKQ